MTELQTIERRCVRISVLLTRLKAALDKGERDQVVNLWEEVRELNWTSRRDLLTMGVPDSILADAGLTEYPPDDDDLPCEEDLDLARLPAVSPGREE